MPSSLLTDYWEKKEGIQVIKTKCFRHPEKKNVVAHIAWQNSLWGWPSCGNGGRSLKNKINKTCAYSELGQECIAHKMQGSKLHNTQSARSRVTNAQIAQVESK